MTLADERASGRLVPAARVRPHPAAGDRGRAVGARRDDAVQGRDRRRRRGAAARRLLPPRAPAHLRRRPRPLRARRAGRRRHRLGRADPQRPAAAGRRGAATCTRSSRSCRPRPTPATTPQIVAERAILRRLVTAGTRIVQMGYDTASGGGDVVGSVDDVVDRAQAEIYDVTERRTVRGLRPHRDAAAVHARRDREDLGHRRHRHRHPDRLPASWTRSPTACTPARWSPWPAGRAAARRSRSTPRCRRRPAGRRWARFEVGDLLLGADGRPTRVVAATEVMVGPAVLRGRVLRRHGDHRRRRAPVARRVFT